jgi:hypothetical protein
MSISFRRIYRSDWKRRSEFFGEQLRFFPGGEVAAPVGLVEVDQGGVELLDPAARGGEDLVGEGGEADRDRDLGRGLAGRQAAWARPPSQYERAAEAPVPVSQYRVMLSRMWSRVRLPAGWPSTEGAGDLVVAVGVVVQHPGGQGDRGVQQGIADRLGPGGLLQEVAKAARPEGVDRGQRGAFLLGVRGQAADVAQRLPEEVQVDAGQPLGGLAAHGVGDGGALVAALGDIAAIAEADPSAPPTLARCGRGPSQHRPARPRSHSQGSDGTTRSKASSARPPCAVGSVNGPTESSISITEPGQPWVMISGSASSCGERMWMKWNVHAVDLGNELR